MKTAVHCAQLDGEVHSEIQISSQTGNASWILMSRVKLLVASCYFRKLS